MKLRLIVVATMFLTLLGCGANAPIKGLNDGYAPNETKYSTGLVLRTGVTPSGNGYTIFRNGDVNLNAKGWEVYPRFKSSCKIDPIDDTSKCVYDSLHRGFFAIRTKAGEIKAFCIGGHDFPGRNGAIRVGKNKAIYTSGDSCIIGAKARLIGKQLLAADEYTVKLYSWPNDFPITATHVINDEFKDIYSLTKYTYRNLTKLQ